MTSCSPCTVEETPALGIKPCRGSPSDPALCPRVLDSMPGGLPATGGSRCLDHLHGMADIHSDCQSMHPQAGLLRLVRADVLAGRLMPWPAQT